MTNENNITVLLYEGKKGKPKTSPISLNFSRLLWPHTPGYSSIASCFCCDSGGGGGGGGNPLYKFCRYVRRQRVWF